MVSSVYLKSEIDNNFEIGEVPFLSDLNNESGTQPCNYSYPCFNQLAPDLGFGIEDSVTNRWIINYVIGILLATVGTFGAIGNGLILFVFRRR